MCGTIPILVSSITKSNSNKFQELDGIENVMNLEFSYDCYKIISSVSRGLEDISLFNIYPVENNVAKTLWIHINFNNVRAYLG